MTNGLALGTDGSLRVWTNYLAGVSVGGNASTATNLVSVQATNIALLNGTNVFGATNVFSTELRVGTNNIFSVNKVGFLNFLNGYNSDGGSGVYQYFGTDRIEIRNAGSLWCDTLRGYLGGTIKMPATLNVLAVNVTNGITSYNDVTISGAGSDLSVGGNITNLGSTIIAGSLTVTNGIYTVVNQTNSGSYTNLTQPLGRWGMLGWTNDAGITVTLPTTSYVIVTNANSVVTNGFIADATMTYLTNAVAGLYRVSVKTDFTGTTGSDIWEGEAVVNGVGNDFTGWRIQLSGNNGACSAGGQWIIYLPANSAVSTQVKNVTAARNMSITRAFLSITTP